MALKDGPRGQKGGRRVCEHLPIDSLAQVMEEYVASQMAKGEVVFALGSYATLKLGHSACPRSMLGMIVLLKLMFKLAPTGIVNYTGMELVFERLGRKWPGLNGTSKSLKTWAGAMSQSLRIAMAHVRKLAQQPKRFDQRTKGLTPEEKQALKELLAMYKKSEGSFVDKFESQDLEDRPRRLRKVDTDEMDFQALCDDLGNGQRKKKKRRTLAKEGGIEVHVQATLKASLLIEAMSASAACIENHNEEASRCSVQETCQATGGGQ